MNKFSIDIQKKKDQIEQLEKEIEDLKNKEDEQNLRTIKQIGKKYGKSIDDLIDFLNSSLESK